MISEHFTPEAAPAIGLSERDRRVSGVLAILAAGQLGKIWRLAAPPIQPLSSAFPVLILGVIYLQHGRGAEPPRRSHCRNRQTAASRRFI